MTRCFALLLGLALATLMACSSRSGSYTQIARDMLTQDRSSYPRTLAEVEAYPYAQLGVRLDAGRPGIAVLAEYESGNHRWVAADGVTLLTSPDGWLLEFLGADQVARSSVDEAHSVAALAGQTFTRTVRTSSEPVRVLNCSLSGPETDALQLLGRSLAVQAFRESCAGESGQSERVIYLSPSGRFLGLDGPMWPGAMEMELRVLKVPA